MKLLSYGIYLKHTFVGMLSPVRFVHEEEFTDCVLLSELLAATLATLKAMMASPPT